MFFILNNEKLKLGDKLRRESDDSIWEITKILDGTHVEITCLEKIFKGPTKQTLSSKSIGFSTILNSFEIETTIVIKTKIHADTKEKAIEIIKNNLEDYVEDNCKELSDSAQIEVVKSTII